MAQDSDTLTVVDLFCGAGGLSLGFLRAGFSVLQSVDHWKPAVTTYLRNVGDHVIQVPIGPELKLPGARVFIGGPPCQGFSSAGLRQGNDERNSLVAVFAELVTKHMPDAFVFENVEGFLTGGHGKFVFELLDRVIQAGYRVHLRKINAAHFGVPQHRKRVLAIGGLGWSPSFPEPTHAAFGAPGAELANGYKAIPSPTFLEALSVLSPAFPRGTKQVVDQDHTFEPLSGDDMRRATLLRPGQRMRDLPEDLWHKSYRRRAYRRVMDGTPSERRGGAPSGVRRLKADEPSKAITGGALRDFLHSTEDRALTIRECAVLQTFPITFQFSGSQAERILLIGNAVPPVLAESVATSLRADFERRDEIDNGPGELLSFVPTLSNGMSPVLESVVSRVRQKYQRQGCYTQRSLQWD